MRIKDTFVRKRCWRSLDETARLDDKEEWRRILYHESVENIARALTTSSLNRVHDVISENDQSLPLHVAASRGIQYTDLLLQFGADVNGTSASHGTALQWAAAEGSLETVDLLIEHGADVNAKAGWKGTALLAAVQANNLPVVEALIKHGADPNQLDHYSQSTPLSNTTSHDIMKVLLENGADAQCLHPQALVNSILASETPAALLLLQHGVDPNVRSRGLTLIEHAVDMNCPEIAAALISHGAEIPKMLQGKLVNLAATYGHSNLLGLLIGRGVVLASLDPEEGYPLTIASFNGHQGIVVTLLEAGVNINHRHPTQGSPLHACLQSGHWDIASMFFQLGAQLPDYEYWQTIHDVSPSLVFWKNLASKHAYCRMEDLFEDWESTTVLLPVKVMEFAWQVPEVLVHQTQSANPETSSHVNESLQNHIVLVRRLAIDQSGNEASRIEALTCAEYIQRRWGSFGQSVLQDVAQCARGGMQGVLQCCK
jgi:ankyrin repeat protein